MKNCGGKISLQFKKIKAQIQSPDILKFVVRSTPLGLFWQLLCTMGFTHGYLNSTPFGVLLEWQLNWRLYNTC